MSEAVHFYIWKEQRDWTPPIYVVEVIRKDGMRDKHKFHDQDEAHSFARKLCEDETVYSCRLTPQNVKPVPIGFHVVGKGADAHLERSVYHYE